MVGLAVAFTNMMPGDAVTRGEVMNWTLLLTILLTISQPLIASTVWPGPASQTRFRTAASTVKEVYEGDAVGRDTMSDLVEGDLGPNPTSFTLELSGYTSGQEADQYAEILKTQGQEGLLHAIGARNLGYFRLTGQPDHQVIFAQQSQNNASRTIAVLCRRWLNTFIEGYQQRAAKYPFAYIELTIDNRGKGEGTMYTAAGVKFTGQTAEVVNVACYDASVEIVNNLESMIGVEDYANSRDWLRDVRLNGAGVVQVRR
jgi:hypothetical protein